MAIYIPGTPTELLNKAYKFLLEQGEPSINEDMNDMCCYRQQTADGRVLKCGVGLFISDDDYSPDIEGSVVTYSEGDVEHPKLAIITDSPESQNVLAAIQRAHDDASFATKGNNDIFISSLRTFFKDVAQIHGIVLENS